MQCKRKELIDGSVLRAMLVIAALQKRNYAIMEVRGNRIKEVRVGVRAKFPAAHFKKVANGLNVGHLQSPS